jgi:DNA-binding PadR family transcriptional regulator
LGGDLHTRAGPTPGSSYHILPSTCGHSNGISDWGTSENDRKAKYYSITKSGRKQLALEAENWEWVAGVIGRLLSLEGQK